MEVLFPKFLIRRMYEKESLQLTDEGFKFTVKNNIANGNVVEVFHLNFNESEIPFNQIRVKNETQEMDATQISPDNPIELKKGVRTIFSCDFKEAENYKDQEVRVKMKFKVRVRDSNLTIDFDFKDMLKSI